MKRVLLMASYCDKCTDDLPCLDCLKMSNIIEIPAPESVHVLGGWDHLTGYKEVRTDINNGGFCKECESLTVTECLNCGVKY